jgi:hypothetical protein
MCSEEIEEKRVPIRDEDDYSTESDWEYQQAREFLRDFHRSSLQLHTIPEEVEEENGADDDDYRAEALVTHQKRARLVKNPKVSCLSALMALQEEAQKSVGVSSTTTTSLIHDDDPVETGGYSWIIPDNYDFVDDNLLHEQDETHHGTANNHLLQCYRLEQNAIHNMKLYSSHRHRKRYHFHPSYSPKSAPLTG